MINRWALLAENFIHTKASGLDNTICTYGTMVQYTKLNSHKLLEAPELKILLIYSGLFINYEVIIIKFIKLHCNIMELFLLFLLKILSLVNKKQKKLLFCF